MNVPRQAAIFAYLAVGIIIVAVVAVGTITSRGTFRSESDPPVLKALYPAEGPLGTKVVIRGSGFASTSNVVHFTNDFLDSCTSNCGSPEISTTLDSSDGTTLYFNIPVCSPPSSPDEGMVVCVLRDHPDHIYVTNANGQSNSLQFTAN